MSRTDAACTWVFVPVQTKVREFTAKVLFGAALAERGLGAVITEQRTMRANTGRFPPSVIVDYSAQLPSAPMFDRYRSHGHRVTAWEEEGLGLPRGDAIARSSRFFAWGEAHARSLRADGSAPPELVDVTGNPRIDLLRPELRALHHEEAERHRRTIGPYVLVNTNFWANVFYGSDNLVWLHRELNADFGSADLEHHERGFEHSRRILTAFRSMIPALAAAFPDRTVVVRPHPSEDHDWWRRELATIPNARVDASGSVVPWILGSDVLIHNSCTTGLEAAILDHPVVTYRPVRDEEHDWELANGVSFDVGDLDALFAAVAAARDGGVAAPRTEAQEALLRDNIAALDGPLATDRIADTVREIAEGLPAARLESRGVRLGRRWVDTKHLVKLALRRPGQSSFAYERQKNPGWTAEEVRSVLEGLTRATGRFGDVAVAPLTRDVTLLWRP